MYRAPSCFRRSLPRILLFATILSIGLGGWISNCRAVIDTEINKTVWKMLWGITDAQLNDPAWLQRDDDGDGMSNGAELVDGTNPERPYSYLRITATTVTANSISMTFPTLAGKLYTAQTTPNLTDPGAWANVSPTVSVVGNGATMTLTVTGVTGANPSYYRASVQDIDSDGDGISDWAEIATGFDPNNTHTNGSPTDDHTALTQDLTIENVYSVTATKGTATQPVSASVAAANIDGGIITVSRSGNLLFAGDYFFLTWSGTAVPGVDYTALPTIVVMPSHVSSYTFKVAPLCNPNRRVPATVTCTIRPGGGYTLSGHNSASVVIAPSGNANGTGLTGYYYDDSTVNPGPGTYSAALFNSANLKITRVDPTVDFTWNGVSPGTGLSATNYAVRWAGQVQPQYSETYFFDVLADDCIKLWVNGQLIIDTWTYINTDRLATIKLQAGAFYDIKLEYSQISGNALAHLYWYSDSQPKQVIPQTRLYPDSTPAAPPAITSAGSAFGFVGQPFSFQVTASSAAGVAPAFALGAGSGPLPPGLTLNGTTGLISGTPTTAGDYPIVLTASIGAAVGANVLDIQILNVGSGVTRELWTTGVTGSHISDIPVNATPNQTNTSLTLEDNTAYSNNVSERLRGYFTAPATGNYYFWLAANNEAELWISDDHEAVNKVRRAWITAPGVASRVWNDPGQPNQKSPWLSLVAGQSYYYEVLRNSGSNTTTDNVAVGYVLDPTGTTANPIANGSGVVPAYLLSVYDFPALLPASGSLFVTNLSPAIGVDSQAAGSSNLQLNAAQTQALLHFNYGGLSSAQTSYGIYGLDDNGSDALLLDLNVIDKFHPELKTPDGGYTWNITGTSAVSAATIVNDIQQGKAYLKVETVTHPNGEIVGYFGLVEGSQVAPVIAADPGYTNDNATDAGAARFLGQAAFGAAAADVASVKSGGYAAWINNQFSLPATHILPLIQATYNIDRAYGQRSVRAINDWWNVSVNAPDQLRQRTAFAFNEIMVVSEMLLDLNSNGQGLGAYYDTLLDNSFGNFRDLLKAVTLHPTMGVYLNMQGNAKGNLATGYHPNENYAREIMQLFSVGLNRQWPDGTLVLDSTGSPVPTYDQGVITNGFARVFTGWNWYEVANGSGQFPTDFNHISSDYVAPMVLVAAYHELGTKTLMDNVVLPAAVGYNPTGAPVAGSQGDPTSSASTAYGLQDLEKAIDNIFYHPNVGPYICRQLIQRLVSSNPSQGYLGRVVQKFNDDGTAQHVRGNLQAVIKAILLDGEARSLAVQTASSGKLREPLLRITGPARTFLVTPNSGSYSQSGDQNLIITTSSPHGYAAGDRIWLDFSVNATGNPATLPWTTPLNTFYTVQSTPAPTANTFSVSAAELTTGTYTQAASSTTLAVTVATQPTNTGGPAVGGKVYLKFLSGGATDGVYTLATVIDRTHYTVTTSGAPAAALSGNLLLPQFNGYYVTKTDGTFQVGVESNDYLASYNLQSGNSFWMTVDALAGAQFIGQQLTVGSIINPYLFNVTWSGPALRSDYQPNHAYYPLVPPVLSRSGSVALPSSKYDMQYTDSQLAQTPFRAPTVFNFFYPDYKFPSGNGALAANNITTPEFQLVTDTNVINLTNQVIQMMLASADTNGQCNFDNGAIYFTLAPYMTSPYSVSDSTGVTNLVNKLSDLLTGGTMGTSSKNVIVNYVANDTNFPPASATNVRDRVRTVAQLILLSSEYAAQH